MCGLFPTHHGQVLTFIQWPWHERREFKADLRANYLATLSTFPPLAERFAAAQISSRLFGMVSLPNFFRRPFGEGWALVGDAGHHKDPLVARGISGAWRDAELLCDVQSGCNSDDGLQEALLSYARLRERGKAHR